MSKNLNEIPQVFQENTFAMSEIKRLIESFKGWEKIEISASNDDLIIEARDAKTAKIEEGVPTTQNWQRSVFTHDEEGNLILNSASVSFLLTDSKGEQINKGYQRDNAMMNFSKEIRVWNKDNVEVSIVQLENQSKAQAEGIITSRIVSGKLERYAEITELDRHIAEINIFLPQTDAYGKPIGYTSELANNIGDECLYTRMVRDPENIERIFCDGEIITKYGSKNGVYTTASANMEHPEQHYMRVDERVFDELHQQYQQDINNRNQEVGRGGR